MLRVLAALVVVLLALVVAALVAGVGFVRGRGGGGRLALSVVVTPLLAGAALMFLQISF